MPKIVITRAEQTRLLAEAMVAANAVNPVVPPPDGVCPPGGNPGALPALIPGAHDPLNVMIPNENWVVG